MELAHDIYKKGKAAGGSGYLVSITLHSVLFVFLRAQLTAPKRAGVSFPFVDRLNDGYTAMTYAHEVLISESATGAQGDLAQVRDHTARQ